jgi:hypothetical protein
LLFVENIQKLNYLRILLSNGGFTLQINDQYVVCGVDLSKSLNYSEVRLLGAGIINEITILNGKHDFLQWLPP